MYACAHPQCYGWSTLLHTRLDSAVVAPRVLHGMSCTLGQMQTLLLATVNQSNPVAVKQAAE